MFQSMLQLLISFALNVVRGDRWDLKWFFRAEGEAAESGTAALCWCTGICTGQHKGAFVPPGTHAHTCRHSFSSPHYWLSKFDCDDFSPVLFLPLAKGLVSLKVAPSLRLPTLLSSIASLLWLNYSWRVVVPNDQFCADTGGFISPGFFVYWCVGWIERCENLPDLLHWIWKVFDDNCNKSYPTVTSAFCLSPLYPASWTLPLLCSNSITMHYSG